MQPLLDKIDYSLEYSCSWLKQSIILTTITSN